MAVVQLKRPRTYTSPEALIEEVRKNLFRDGRTQKAIAAEVGVSQGTIHNLASGKTRWPRPTTLFPTLDTLDLEMRLVKKGAPK